MLRTLFTDLVDAWSHLDWSAAMRPGATGPHEELAQPGERLSDWLPYRAWLDDRQVFVNRDGLGLCLELRPQSGADEEMARVLTALFAASPAGAGLQFHLLASPGVRPTLLRYARLRLSDDVAGSAAQPLAIHGREARHENIHRTMARQRFAHALAGSRRSLLPTQAYLFRHYRLVLSLSVPGSPDDLSRLDALLLLRDSVRATLHAGGFPSRVWTADDLLNWVSALLDPHRFGGDAAALHHDEGRSLAEQVIDRGTRASIGAESIVLHNPAPPEGHLTSSSISHSSTPSTPGSTGTSGSTLHLKLLSVRSFPPRFALWNAGSLIGDLYQGTLQYPCPFLLTLSAHVPDAQSSRQTAMLKAARATTNASSAMARFLPDLQERKADWDIVLKALDAGQQLVDLSLQVTLFSDAAGITRAEQAARAIFRARGFELATDALLMAQALLTTLPMSLSAPMHADLRRMKRVSTKTSANAVHLAPLVAEWAGTGTPVLLFGGRRGQLMAIDVFDNPAGNYNVAIAGTSGSGKSLLLNEIAASYLGTGARVWIIDVGRSYERACRNFGGTFIEFTEHAPISLNPFALVEDIDEDMELLQPLLAQMVSPREPLDAFGYAMLGTAIKRVWTRLGRSMTVSDVHDVLASGRLGEPTGDAAETAAANTRSEGDRRLMDLAAMLQPYTRSGVYGRYFHGGEPIDFSNDFIVLELEELKARKDLQTVVLLIVMYRITREMYFSRERKKIVIIDEAWDLLSGGATADFIEAGYRRARKYRGAFMSATQGVDDYHRHRAARAALDNSDWMFLLRQKPESIESMDKLGQLAMDDGMKRLMQSLRTEHGAYSEVFIHSPAGSGVGRLIVDPYTLLLFSSRAEDFSAIQARRAAGLSIAEAIESVLRERGLA